MKKSVKQILKNNRGGVSYIYLCVIVLIASMMFSVLIMYMGLCAQVQIQKRDVKHKLDAYLSEVAIEEFDSIKQGAHYNDHLNYEMLERGAYQALGFTSESDVYEYSNSNCVMTYPKVSALRGDGFGLKVEYIAVFHIEWNGKTYTNLKIPVSVTGYFKMK